MNKKLLMAASAFVIAAFSTPAFAGCDGIYLAGRGGIINHNVGDKESDLSDEKLEIDDNALMLSAALGYRWGYFRIEAEYVWRDETDDTKHSTLGSINSQFESTSYMANIYWDLSPYTWFTPYVSAGIGMTELEYNFNNRGRNGAITNKDSFDETNFTWSVGGGLSAQVTNRFNVDLGYRYYDMGDIGEASIHAHEVYGGLRYVF